MTKITNTLLGHTANGDKYYLTIELRHHNNTVETIRHDEMIGYKTLSFTGSLISKYGSIVYDRGIRSLGQNYGDLLDITKPAEGFTRADVERIYELWQELHLNDMQSHCAHQDRAIKWDTVDPCSVTGYRAGSAWLLNPLSEDLINETFALITRSSFKAVA